MGDQRRREQKEATPPPPTAYDVALLVQAERALLDMARRLAMFPHHAESCVTARAVAERLRARAATAPAAKSAPDEDE